MHTLELPVFGQQASIMAFGPEDAEGRGLENWSLKPLQCQTNVPKNERLAEALGEELGGFGVDEAFAPNIAAASGVVVGSAELTSQIRLKETLLCRNRALPADGVLLEENQAFVGSFAGCPVIIAVAGEYMIVAHAARDSILDRGALNGRATRKHFSVVHAIIEKFQKRGCSVNEMAMVMLFSTPAMDFEHSTKHPTYGAYNRKLIGWVDAHYPGGIVRRDGSTFLDLENVFVEQARMENVRLEWAMCSLAEYPKLERTASSNKRNLFIVKRTA